MRRRAAWLLVPVLATAPGALGACNDLLGTPDPVLRDAGAVDGTVPIVDSSAPSADTGAPSIDAGDAGIANARDAAPTLLVGDPAANHGLKSLYGLALQGSTLFGTDWYTPNALVYSVDVSSPVSDPPPFFPAAPDAGHGAANAIVADPTNVYFAVFQATPEWQPGVYRVDQGGDGGLIASASGVGWMTIDAFHLYWAQIHTSSVWRANKDGSEATEFAVGKTQTRILAKGGFLYYATASGVVASDPSNPVNAITMYFGASNVDAFDVGASNVVWADRTAQKVYRAPVGGGSAVDITPPGFSFLRKYVQVLTDDVSVYLVTTDIDNPGTSSASVLSRWPIGGGAAEVMVSLNDAISAIVQDADALYFTTYGNDDPDGSPPPYSAVWRLAK